MKGKIRLWLIGVAGCLVLAAAWGLMVAPRTALADHKGTPHGKGGGGGGGETEDIIYVVDVVYDPDLHGGFIPVAPIYLPTCPAETKGTYRAFFPRHDPCATVVTSTGYELTDDIVLHVLTNQDGDITSFQLVGQDVIGREGIVHESELVVFDPPVIPSPFGFVLHVDVDNLAIWKLDKHRRTGGAKRVEIVGDISIGDLLYTPIP